ncbi:MAG: PorT family protein [Cyclobacteriaceae bacterium]|nr:PorT family protein [Cyclobacteriaceae bacterium]
MRILSLFLCLLGFSLHAQSTKVSLRGGPKIGLDLSIPNKAWFTDEIYSSGGNAGGFVEIGLGRYFAVQTEALVEQHSYSWQYGNIYSIREKFSYFNFPVLIKYKIKRFRIYGGYQWSVFNFAERKMNEFDDGSSGINQAALSYRYNWYNANQMYRNRSAAILFGLDYSSPKGFGLTYRFTKGLSDITLPGIGSIYLEEDHIYNSYFTIGTQYTFGKIYRDNL